MMIKNMILNIGANTFPKAPNVEPNIWPIKYPPSPPNSIPFMKLPLLPFEYDLFEKKDFVLLFLVVELYELLWLLFGF